MRLIEITGDKKLLLRKIVADCQPFLKRIGNKIGTYTLFRGMDELHSSIMVRKKVRLDNRKPMSSARIKHDRYNHYFEETFGQPFRNSMYASGDKLMARYYGNVFAVFPIGDFDWLWSPTVNDIALDIRWPMTGGQLNVPPSQEAVNARLDSLYSMNSDLIGAIKSGNEIMIRCKEYYAVIENVITDDIQ